jgi:hypothetical protein
MSTTSASLANSLTHRSTTGQAKLQAIKGAESSPVLKALMFWLGNLSWDKGLAMQLLLAVLE